MAVTSRPRPRRAPPRVDRLPPWRVLLHNDDVNDIGYVVETIIELMRFNPRIALMQTLTAHQRGLALLVTTHREHAELLQDQFKSKSLTVTIEPEG
jgi:ATP-dependent Clp protease adaptor protein ClpS